jgi:hypothetical protein
LNNNTLLLRQVHPHFLRDGSPTSQAFKPNTNDQNLMSVYDGDQITAVKAWMHYTLKLQSAGVVAVSVEECVSQALSAKPDPLDSFPEHAVIDFNGHEKHQINLIAINLRNMAIKRGWLHLASENNL